MDAFPTEASSRNAQRYLSTDNDGDQSNRVSVHSLFYTICQAAFYIMCFRGKECIQYYRKAVEYYKNLNLEEETAAELDESISILLDYSDPQLIDITSKRWNRLCSHHLNPLKFCLESVRGEFLVLADNFDLMDHDVLDKLIVEDRKLASSLGKGIKAKKVRKKRKSVSIQTAATLERRRIVGGVGGLGKGSNPLDSFFPFDPYLLRRSYTFVESHYRHWNGSSCVDSDGIANKDIGEELEEEVDIDHDDYHDAISVESENDLETDNDHSDDEEEDQKQGTTAMSLTSTTVSMGGSEWTDDLTDTELNSMDTDNAQVPLKEKTWVNELKRARALSITDDCW
jgi:RNA polymerase I-specific transcription initiation factor RRN3